MLWTILIILLVLALVGGVYGAWGGAGWGYYGWSPLGLLIIVALLLYVFGGLH